MSPLRNRALRKRVVVSAAAGTAAVALTVGVGVALAEDPDTLDAGRYIVQLADPPVASYDGGIAGMSATSPDDGTKVDLDSQAVQIYQTHLARQRDEVKTGAQITATEHEYDIVYNGFTADLTEAQLAELSSDDSVVGIYPDGEVTADTSTTPDFLGLAGDGGAWAEQFGGPETAGEGVIVGILDSGFWPENDSFAALPEPRPDQDVIDAKWNGECVTGDEADDADNVTCNNKVIGARYYPDGVDMVDEEFASPRDYHGHGSHVGGTAAGNHAVEAGSYGQISGMAPAARLAMYKVCWRINDSGCNMAHSNGVAALEDAVADGVDVINYSISGSTDTVMDVMHEAFFHTAAAGVFIATSAGNNGPDSSTVAHNVPWMTTVASGTHDRDNARAPELAESSSAGPAIAGGGDLLKPDVLAPGVSIQAAHSPASRTDGSMFGAWSGTSMASPHIAGIGALLLSANPDWSPMAVKSAIMTTATSMDNTGEAIQRGDANAGPFDYGNGLTQPAGAFDPGLVYESDADQWWQYACALGEATGDVCDEVAAVDASDLNYPTIAIGDLDGAQTVVRTVTSVADQAEEFTVAVTAPAGVEVAVDQETITLEPGESVTFAVTFTLTDDASSGYGFGSLTWSSASGHQVNSTIAVGVV